MFHIPDHDAASIVATMDRVGIDQVCLSSFAALEVDYSYGNDMVADAIRQFGDRIMGFACINPYEQKDIIPELERCFDQLRMSAIKLHPAMNECDPESEKFIPVYEFAQARKLTIMNHSWGTAAHLSKLASRYDRVNFIQAHTATAWNGVQEPAGMFDVIREMDNVFVDTAGTWAIVGVFEKAVERVGANKIIFGTDFPFLDATIQIANVVMADIGEEAKRSILRSNFLKLVRPDKP